MLEPLVRIAQKQARYCQYLVINPRNVVNVDDVALESCENALLKEVSGTRWIGAHAVELNDIALLSGLNGSDLAMLDAEMSVCTTPVGD